MSEKDELRQKGRFDLRDRWVNFTTKEGLADNRVFSLMKDRASHIWCRTPGGISRYDGQRWQSFTTADGLADNAAYALLEDRAGNIWCETRGGVSCYDRQQWQSFTI